MKHRLLILGTLGEFVQLVKKSKERGHYTIVCDGYPDLSLIHISEPTRH